MPYKTVNEAEKKNPALEKYSAKAKRGWIGSFNQCMADGGPEDKCYAIAYSVANKVDGRKPSTKKSSEAKEIRVAKGLVKLAKYLVSSKGFTTSEGITQKQLDKLADAIIKAESDIKELFKVVPITKIGRIGRPGDEWVSFKYYSASLRGNSDEVAQVWSNTDKGDFSVSILGIERSFNGDVTKFTRFLEKGIPSLFKRALSRLGITEQAMIMGRLTTDNLVGEIGRVTAEFDTIEEWVQTTVNVPIRLKTSKSVPSSLVAEWARKNWYDIAKKAPSKTPSMPEGRGMGYDEPNGGFVEFITPSSTTFRDEDYYWKQSGNKGVFSVDFSTR